MKARDAETYLRRAALNMRGALDAAKRLDDGDRAEILEGSPAEVAASLGGKIKELGLLSPREGAPAGRRGSGAWSLGAHVAEHRNRCLQIYGYLSDNRMCQRGF